LFKSFEGLLNLSSSLLIKQKLAELEGLLSTILDNRMALNIPAPISHGHIGLHLLHHHLLLLVHHLLLVIWAFVAGIWLLVLENLLLECLILVQVLHILEMVLLEELWVVMLLDIICHWVNKYTWVLLLISTILLWSTSA